MKTSTVIAMSGVSCTLVFTAVVYFIRGQAAYVL